ncbi:MAG: hypothetical protein Q4E70_00590 [Candidatus Saccharibacteria bacterium]|nr:hypothetical protein [Candidatus Saccharibacteria bacterium]
MGYEGLDGSRDVANEEKKHPWEVFPEDDSVEGGKNKEQREKQKARQKKRQARINTLKNWAKNNKLLSIGIVLLVIALIVGGIFLVQFIIEKNNQKEEPAPAIIVGGIPENTTIETAVTPDVALSYAQKKLAEAANVNIVIEGTSEINHNKVQDNIDTFIKNLDSDYEKIYYRLISIMIYCGFEDVDRAEYFLSEFDKENHELDKKTRYVYLLAKINYYSAIDNPEEVKKYRDILDTEYPIYENFLDDDTEEVITDKEILKKMEADFESLPGKTEEGE